MTLMILMNLISDRDDDDDDDDDDELMNKIMFDVI